MALTRIDLTGDGVTTVYDLTFGLGYLREEDIYVSLDEDLFINQLKYSFLSESQVALDTPVPTGVKFNIRRVVERDALINDYESGAILREEDLDDSFSQALMIQQEIADGYQFVDRVDGVADEVYVIESGVSINGELDMNGYRITDVGDPQEPRDAVNVQSVDQLVSDRLVSADPEAYLDYGLITEVVNDEQDYGSLN